MDMKGLITALKQIKEKRASAEKATSARVMQDFRNASASNAAAIAFYERAVQATQYDGKTHAPSDFQDWLKTDADKLKSDGMQNAARLHLNYLILTIQRAGGATTKQLEQGLLAHIAAVIAAGAVDDAVLARRDKAQDLKDAGFKSAKGAKPPSKEPLFWDQDLIKQGVEKSVFVQWYGVSKMISDVSDWESIPGNLDGMYQKTLLPYYREIKDLRAIAYWDAKIQQEGQQATSSALSFKIEQFNAVRRPQLLWKRALDMIAIGQRNRGLGEMLNLIKSFPDHQDLPDWITTLEGLITPPASTVPATAGQPAGAS